MRMFAVQHGKVAPRRARRVQPLDFGSDPMRFLLGRAEFCNADFFAFAIFRRQRLGWQQRRFFVVLDHFAGHAQNALR